MTHSSGTATDPQQKLVPQIFFWQDHVWFSSRQSRNWQKVALKDQSDRERRSFGETKNSIDRRCHSLVSKNLTESFVTGHGIKIPPMPIGDQRFVQHTHTFICSHLKAGDDLFRSRTAVSSPIIRRRTFSL